MFVMLLLFCEVTQPDILWEENWKILIEDIPYILRKRHNMPNLNFKEGELKNFALLDIERIMERNNRTLMEFSMIPYPKNDNRYNSINKLVYEELDYDTDKLKAEHDVLREVLNSVHEKVYSVVMQSIERREGGLFFVYGSGGTGKTYLWNTIISELREQSKVVLAVASSGIASLLLPGGRTAHSIFKIPISLKENSTCDVSENTQLAQLICQADVIIWDEAPMVHRYAFEALERTVKDLMNPCKKKSRKKERVFGGKTLLLGGDFRQILPVIPHGGRQEIVDASISRSKLWKHFKVFQLTENMRLMNKNSNDEQKQAISAFSEWVLKLGDGKLLAMALEEHKEPTWIKVPDDLLIQSDGDSVGSIIADTYPDLIHKYEDVDYLKERCILTSKNDTVEEINDRMISLLPGEEYTFLSSDSVSPLSRNFNTAEVVFTQEYMNSQKISGVPNHVLRLKIGVPVILMRNLNPSAGICNGTRLVVTKIGIRMLEAQIITGKCAGNYVCIPRIVLQPTESNLTFILRRVQFPIKVCFAMTIHKSQGQSMKHVGIYLPKPIFSHGQLYVAVSRTTSREGLKMLIDKTEDNVPEGYTQNVVYKEIFINLH
ncbi:hypothetical protein MKX03_028415 [Papaver bracteatum]|nr:hypothetical protein MKX03_028415 [Papaver bracteatum]